MVDIPDTSDPSTRKLGRRPAHFNKQAMQSAIAMDAALRALGPPPASSRDYLAAVTSPWGMLLNDQLGDCLVEGTVVDAANIKAAYKAPYKGPIIRLTCASGKTLTVTPNHAVLTPRGFVCAKDLKEGDNLIGTSRSQIFPRGAISGGQNYFNHTPAPIEQIFSSFAVSGNPTRKIMPTPIYFHGDGQFLDGNVNVIASNGFLWNELDPSLSQPDSEDKISSTSKLQRSFHRARASMQTLFRCFPAAFGNVCFSGNGASFAYAHTGIAESQGQSLRSQSDPRCFDLPSKKMTTNAKFSTKRLHQLPPSVFFDRLRKIADFSFSSSPLRFTQGSRLQAGRNHPSSKGVPTDAELCANLFKTLPGLVELDSLVNVENDKFEGHIFDLSTDRRWYIANGLVTHNCVCADTGHALMLRTSNSTKATVIPTDDDILKLYETVGGYVPGEADTDGGCNESDMCHYLVQNGFLGHKANSTGHVEPLHTDNLKWCVELFGTCRVGINLPQSALDQNAAGQIWDVKGDSTIVGGHDVPLVKYECDTLICLTWAKPQPMTLEFAKKYIDEAHSELFYDWIMEQGTAPSGFSLNDLSQRLLAIQY